MTHTERTITAIMAEQMREGLYGNGFASRNEMLDRQAKHDARWNDALDTAILHDAMDAVAEDIKANGLRRL